MPRKSIFVTGGASGIGKAVAQHFANQGWYVGLADIDMQGLADAATLFPVDQCSTYKLDVRDRKQWQKALADFWTAADGRLDVLFNNAGVAHGGNFAEVKPEEHDLMIDVNLTGVIRGAEAGYRYLKQTSGSCLLNTCSAAGIYGPGGLAVYGATKFGVRGLTEALDTEWAADGIKVRSLMPGFIDTPLIDSIQSSSNRPVRQDLKDAGHEIAPVATVAEAAWAAVHGKQLHTKVGKLARQAWLISRLLPGLMRSQARKARLSADALLLK